MSKQMTPCKKLGYKVGDKFTIIEKSYMFNVGDVAFLQSDDGSSYPFFTNDKVKEEYPYGVACPLAGIKPIAKLKPAKQALADAIHQNGGWADGAEWCAISSADMKGSFWNAKEHWLSRENGIWCGYGYMHGRCFSVDRLPANHHQTILSRDEYYHAYPKADADGWIEHDGKHEPAVATSGLTLWCRWSDGLEQSHEANMVDWIDDSDVRIIAYRPHKPEVKPEFCESVMRSIPEPEFGDAGSRLAKALELVKSAAPHMLRDKYKFDGNEVMGERKPTIEQLAQDYRNKLGFAKRKQQEADDAKAAADAALGELERAGAALGLLIGIAKPDREPELVITDWRDLQVNDVIFVGEYDGYESGEYVVAWLEDSDYDGDYAVMVVGIDGIERCMDTAMEWRFIRRP